MCMRILSVFLRQHPWSPSQGQSDWNLPSQPWMVGPNQTQSQPSTSTKCVVKPYLPVHVICYLQLAIALYNSSSHFDLTHTHTHTSRATCLWNTTNTDCVGSCRQPHTTVPALCLLHVFICKRSSTNCVGCKPQVEIMSWRQLQPTLEGAVMSALEVWPHHLEVIDWQAWSIATAW